MHYVDEGKGHPILMVAGTPMWSFMYRHPIKALRDSFRCIAVDLPEFGLSEARLVADKAFGSCADRLQAFVQKLNLNNFTLAVHATAGPSALEMAVREHQRVHSLVISNSFAWPPKGKPIGAFVRIVSSNLFGSVNYHLNLLPRISARIGRRKGRMSIAEKQAILGPFQELKKRRHLQNYLRSLRTESSFFEALEKHLSLLQPKPALLIYGAHDTGFKAGFLDKWKKALPNHRTVLFPEAGHYLLEDMPDQYSKELRGWLTALTTK